MVPWPGLKHRLNLFHIGRSARRIEAAISGCSQRGGTMARDFETDPEYQAQLDWADEFASDDL
jgi:hypothetical protein